MAMGLSMVQVPCEVGQNHAMTMSFFSCNPSAKHSRIGKIPRLQVTICTSLRVVTRQSLIMKKHPAQFNPCFRHGIVLGKNRRWKMTDFKEIRARIKLNRHPRLRHCIGLTPDRQHDPKENQRMSQTPHP